nr:fructosamine kinase family protein [Mariprofundus ferrooxydans]
MSVCIWPGEPWCSSAGVAAIIISSPNSAKATDLLWAQVARSISDATGHLFQLHNTVPVGGGSINEAYCLHGQTAAQAVTYFVKCNRPDWLVMFEAEADGLQELGKAGAICVPEPVCHGTAATKAWLVTEYICFAAPAAGSNARLGRELAALHRCQAERFGWSRDNTIGSTPQLNTPSDSWVDFFRDQRLGFQLSLTAKRGFSASLQDKGERLQADLGHFFSAYRPQPSLLHGDLWGGNRGFDQAGTPVLFDPAVYYGDREADIAMTELFGGFDAAFYAAYCEAWPLDAGYGVRKSLYNLYHILNHANLFGGGYARQAESMMDQLLAEY